MTAAVVRPGPLARHGRLSATAGAAFSWEALQLAAGLLTTVFASPDVNAFGASVLASAWDAPETADTSETIESARPRSKRPPRPRSCLPPGEAVGDRRFALPAPGVSSPTFPTTSGGTMRTDLFRDCGSAYAGSNSERNFRWL